MTQTSAGLPNGGDTTFYRVSYDDTLSAADGLNRAAALMGVCDTDFNTMQNWFRGTTLPYPVPYDVQIQPGGAWSAGWGSGPPIGLIPGNGSPLDLVRFLLVSEVTEMFMLQQGVGWSPLASSEGAAGEGLSHFLATQLLINIGSPLRPSSLADLWLNSPRDDFVNHVDHVDHSNDPKSACAVLFLWYLFTQLGFTVNSIVAAGDPQLSGVYRNLTGHVGDPFPYFKALLDAAYPSQTSSTIPGPNRDNPYPLGLMSFWMDKNTFGHDEVEDVLNSPAAGSFPKSFWLVLEGFNRQVLGTATPAMPSGPARGFAGISIPPDVAGTEFELPGNLFVPQRVRFPYDVNFSATSLPAFPAIGNDQELELDGAITVGGVPFTARTDLEFVGGEDPYFTNIDPGAENVFYLSQDLRVFTGTPGLNPRPVAGGPTLADSIPDAYLYVQRLTNWLNQNFGDPSGPDPFAIAGGFLPNQSGAYTGDSSVTPVTSSGSSSFNNYNFGLARVRLRGAPGRQANGVRVFFRLWSTQSADTDFQPGSTYPSHLDGAGKPDWPLPASGSHTFPFFATGNSPNLTDPANPEYGANGGNKQDILIGSGGGRWAYFGCFLNLYDPANLINGHPVQSLLVGDHHCLVAQIAYDGAPIVNANGITESPENSDKLAQRNLQVTHSGNPGWPATHHVPQTFDLRPSASVVPGNGLLGYPDELMIDWGAIPKGTVAEIFWPQADAAEVVGIANALYGTSQLSIADAQTIRCEVDGGTTYVPIPVGTPENLAGLLNVDLPSTVVYGEEFNIVVRRVSTRRFDKPREGSVLVETDRKAAVESAAEGASPPAPGATMPTEHGTGSSTTDAHLIEVQALSGFPETKPVLEASTWRYVVGTFQVKVPVTDERLMLPAEANALAIFRWRLHHMSPANRWRKVLERYVGYLADKVHALKSGGAPADDRDPGFAEHVRAFARAIVDNLPKDESRRKEPERIYSTLEDLLELEATHPSATRRAAIERQIDLDPAALGPDQATELIFGLKELLIRDGDASILFAIADDELRWTIRTTSWLTWDGLFGATDPPGLKEYLAGNEPTAQQVSATRRRLITLLRARIEDMQVHRARQALRRHNLRDLTLVLGVVLIVLVPLTALTAAAYPGPSPVGVLLAVLGGMLGALLSGTFKARDTLTRAADIASFRDGLPAQILVGAAAALAIVVIVGGGLVTISTIDLSPWQSLLALGFVAGFSEPFFLGTIKRATTLGDPQTSAPAQPK
jgi:hypothetical protein